MVHSSARACSRLYRFHGRLRPAAVLGLCCVLVRFPGSHSLRQGSRHFAMAAGAERGRGRTVRERCLRRGLSVVWTPMGRGPVALASPRACRPDGGIPLGCGGTGGASTARPVVAPNSGRQARVAAGLVRPQADAGTLLRYALGESTCSVAGPRLDLVGRALPVSVLDPAERGPCPDVVLSVDASPSLQGAVPKPAPAPPPLGQQVPP